MNLSLRLDCQNLERTGKVTVSRKTGDLNVTIGDACHHKKRSLVTNSDYPLEFGQLEWVLRGRRGPRARSAAARAQPAADATVTAPNRTVSCTSPSQTLPRSQPSIIHTSYVNDSRLRCDTNLTRPWYIVRPSLAVLHVVE